MRVTRLVLHNFRNYETADVDLPSGIVVFEGANGQGKTNLVEAIAFLGSLKSHRVSQDAALVRFGCSQAIVRAELGHGQRRLPIDVEINKSGTNRARVHDSVVKARELPRFFTSVIFAPEDLSLVRGDPSGRRAFLDDLLAIHSPRFAETIARYERVLKQRNSLLRSAKAQRIPVDQLGTLAVWDDQLVELGTKIIVGRLDIIERLRPHLANAYQALVGADHGADVSMRITALADSSSLMDEDDNGGQRGGEITVDALQQRFRERLQDARERELDRGVTLVGPHRDDATFWLNGLPARVTASHGESWSYALSLKLASAQLIRNESRTGDPVLILDDVFAELDQNRRERLANAVGDFEQVLITCAVLNDIPPALREQRIRIHAGTIAVETQAGDANG
nr:DNA replication/repair protein RecF [Pseudoclavibacter sp. Marseille-Q3772]